MVSTVNPPIPVILFFTLSLVTGTVRTSLTPSQGFVVVYQVMARLSILHTQ